MKKLLMLIVSALLIAFSIGLGASYAGEIDLLLQKLVDKGVLTAGEAQQIGTETKEQVKKEIAEGKYSSLPAWVQNTKLKGDFRLRYELDKDKNSQDNSRVRIRTRLGLESKINNKLKMAVGIATGATNDPRSRNITLGNDPNQSNTPGSPKSIVLDYAYAQYMPFNGLTLSGGKIQNPLWQPHDVFWKGDITPDGAGINFTHKLTSKADIFMNDLFYAMKNDSRTDKQVFLAAFQPGVNFAFDENTNLKSAFTYNRFFNMKGANQFANAGTRTNTIIGGRYTYNYDSIQPSMELSFKEPLHGLVPYAALFGDYIRNVAMTGTDTTDPTGKGGFDVGLKFGTENITDWGQWRVKLIYSKLGRDCWLDIFTNSDRYGGKTNSKAYEAIFSYGLGKNTWLDLHYYYAESLMQPRNPGHVLQVDWNMKF